MCVLPPHFTLEKSIDDAPFYSLKRASSYYDCGISRSAVDKQLSFDLQTKNQFP